MCSDMHTSFIALRCLGEKPYLKGKQAKEIVVAAGSIPSSDVEWTYISLVWDWHVPNPGEAEEAEVLARCVVGRNLSCCLPLTSHVAMWITCRNSMSYGEYLLTEQ